MDSAPDRFFCPLTLEVMRHPLQHKVTKHNFEKAELIRWMFVFSNTTCPMTRQNIHPDYFRDNHLLRMEIQRWREENGLDDEFEDDDFNVDEDEDPAGTPNTKSRDDSRSLEVLCALDSLRERILRDRQEMLRTFGTSTSGNKHIIVPRPVVVSYLRCYA